MLSWTRRISIHAPRTGSDRAAGRGTPHSFHFNPRSPHGERRYRDATRTNERRFQSTLPARGATRSKNNINIRVLFQSTLPARGATIFICSRPLDKTISIHAPRTGSDKPASSSDALANHFNPRSPHGERHAVLFPLLIPEIISIHAPRTGSDTL